MAGLLENLIQGTAQAAGDTETVNRIQQQKDAGPTAIACAGRPLVAIEIGLERRRQLPKHGEKPRALVVALEHDRPRQRRHRDPRSQSLRQSCRHGRVDQPGQRQLLVEGDRRVFVKHGLIVAARAQLEIAVRNANSLVPGDDDGARRLLEVVRYARPKDHAEKIVIVMVETPAAMEKAGEIAAVPGVDVVNIGVHDVALAAGFPGQPEHPEVEKLIDQAIARIRKAGKHVALNVLDSWEKRMPLFQAKGVLWWNVRARTFLDHGVKEYVELLKRHGG